MKKALSVLLALTMLFMLVPAAFAASEEANEAAEALHALGLFQGTGTNADGTPIYDLDRVPTRHEAVTMLVRLLGKEAEAKAGNWETPFTDVDDWAKPYVGYAYANGLTNGTGAATFGGKDTIDATQYLTFVLRALGYSSDTDFKWNAAWELSDRLGITNGEYDDLSSFLRGDIAEISVNALRAYQKDSFETLADRLIEDGVFTREQYEQYVQYENVPTRGLPVEDEHDNEQDEDVILGYVKSVNSDVFHHLWCGEVVNIKEKNMRFYYYYTREEMISLGFRPCRVCNP